MTANQRSSLIIVFLTFLCALCICVVYRTTLFLTMCPCFDHFHVVSTSSHTNYQTFKFQFQYQAIHKNIYGILCSFNDACARGISKISRKSNDYCMQSLMLIILTVILLIFFLLKSPMWFYKRKKEYNFSINTPVESISFKHGKRYLTHTDIVKLVNQNQCMNIDPKLIRIFVSNKLIANHDKVDLQKTRQISVFARALGGGRSSKVQGPCQMKSCGRNEPNSKYFNLAAFPPEKRNVITSGNSN